jgi:hypothetical protein
MFGVPPFFKEIFEHLPNALSDLISWREMLSEVTSLSNRLITGKGETLARAELQKVIPADIVITSNLTGAGLTTNQGEKILQLYFLQIMKAQKLFLDFRPKHFSFASGILQWNPNGLWAQFDLQFQNGIRLVYQGYYKNDDQLFSHGLIECNLIKLDWSDDKKNEVIAVFKNHFSNGRGEKISFTMEGFKYSFSEIFKTLVKNKIKLDKNFLYLGIMLATLCISLNKIGGEYDVSKIFNDIK